MAGTNVPSITVQATSLATTDLLYLAADQGGGIFLDRKMPVSLIGDSAFRRLGIGVVPDDTIKLFNTTAATLGAQQNSPGIRFSGQGFSTDSSASRNTDWRIYCTPIQGAANPTSSLLFTNEINGGGFITKLTLTELGQLFTSTSVNAGSNVNATLAVNAGTTVNAGTFSTVPAAGQFLFLTRGIFAAAADGVFTIYNSAGTDFSRLQLGGTTSSFPSIGRNGIFLEFIAADGSSTASTALYNTKTSGTNFERITTEFSANVGRMWTEKGSGGGTARAFVLGADATELMRFESGSKLSFYGVAAVTRPSVPDGSTLAAVIDALQSLGLFNTV